MTRYDPWNDPKYTMRFTARVTVLYMTREDMEQQVKKGHVPSAEFKRYWDGKTGPKHLEEISVEVSGSTWDRLKKWLKTWGHKGGGWYSAGPGGKGYAVRAGGVNQNKDPLNVFFLEE